MRLTLGFTAALGLLAGCSTFSPPKPPQCEGEFRPINAPAPQAASLSMNQADSLAMCTAKGANHAHKG